MKKRAKKTPPFRARRGGGPSERTIGGELQRLRTQVENSKDPIVVRISYSMELAIMWARGKTVGWPLPAEEAIEEARILRDELKQR